MSDIREGLEQILINGCEECVQARFGDARDASACLSPLTKQIISYLKSQIEQMENPYEFYKGNNNYTYVLPDRSSAICSTDKNRDYLSYGFEVGRQKILGKLQ